MIISDNRNEESKCGCRTFAVDYGLRKDKYQPNSPVNPNWLRLCKRQHIHLNRFVYYWSCWDGDCDRRVIQIRKQYTLWQGIKVQIAIWRKRVEPEQEYYDLKKVALW